MPTLTKRHFMGTAMAVTAGSALSVEAAAATKKAAAKASMPQTDLIWLDGAPPKNFEGVTLGVPWPRGALKKNAPLNVAGAASQSWPIAYWPDGSVKWTAHAVGAGAEAQTLPLSAGKPSAGATPISVSHERHTIIVSTGDHKWHIATSGQSLIRQATVKGRAALTNAILTLRLQNRPELEEGALSETTLTGEVTSATVEQSGPVRAVVRVEGKFTGNGREILPFTLRLYGYAGGKSLRAVFSFIYDADADKDFIRGLGLTTQVPMTDELYNRHVRFSGENRGVWGEAIRPLTGLRRQVGREAADAQVNGRFVALEQMAKPVQDGLQWIPPWGDFTLSQPNSDGYHIRKRTEPGHAWIDAAGDKRATGLAYIGGSQGGAALGLNNFWQMSPTRLDVRNAATETATLTAWMWSPEAPIMDMRTYRPVWGMDTHEKEIHGLNITYEDYEEGYDKAYGIAHTSELMIYAFDTTPERADFAEMAENLSKTPRLTVSPKRLHEAGVFGYWTVPDHSTPVKAAIENRLTYDLEYYLKQIDQHRWYGFWNYGDVMHAYDTDRHVWRYDIGGYAWDNSELSTDMTLWFGFLRTGRADFFRMAEAMTRHTGEVDVYHIGPWRGMGTRHGVQHFSDSSKQQRVSNAAYRRYYYYLTADERCGDLMRALNDSDQALKRVDITRKVRTETNPFVGGDIVEMSFGTMWGSIISAWYTEWERTGDTQWRDRIAKGMISIAKLKYGWFASGEAYDLRTHTFVGKGDKVRFSHLNGVFGVYEMHAELLELIDIPEYRKAWTDYCQQYNAPVPETAAFLGLESIHSARNLREGHSRFTAFAAVERNNKALATRAWHELLSTIDLSPEPVTIEGPAVLHPTVEDPSISTNGIAQWGMAAIANLALIGDDLEEAYKSLPERPRRRQN